MASRTSSSIVLAFGVGLLVGVGSGACLDFDRAYLGYCDGGQCPPEPGQDAGCTLLGLNAGCADGGDSACCSGNCLSGTCAASGLCRADGELCSDDTDCCADLGCNGATGRCEVATAGSLPMGFVCSFHDQCSDGYCSGGRCLNPATCGCGQASCGGVGYSCATRGCCPGSVCFEDYPSGCKVEPGQRCVSHQSCTTLNCGPSGKCEPCRDLGVACDNDFSCCSGNCGDDGTCAPCLPPDSACTEHVECCGAPVGQQWCDSSTGNCLPP